MLLWQSLLVRIVPSLAALALPLWLAGCAHFELKPLDVTQSASDFDARTLDTPELRAFIETNLGPVSAWPPAQWDFKQLTFAALFLHPQLDVARAELASVRAAEITAGGRPNPTVGVTPEYNFNAASGVSPWIATVQFELPTPHCRAAAGTPRSNAAPVRCDARACPLSRWGCRTGPAQSTASRRRPR